MLGHSSITITLDIYAHVLDEMQEEAVGKLDANIAKYIAMAEEAIEDFPPDTIKEAAGAYIIDYPKAC